jgi:diguanylate cyclase (GGDEF)-like protein
LRERAAYTIRLKHQAQTDELTKILNRRAFEARGQARLEKAGATGGTFLVLLDIDHFKSINDRYGHPMGDRVLVAVAGALSNNVRPGDIVARFGGEEFAILIEARDVESAHALVCRLQQILRQLNLKTARGKALAVTASFGVAQATGVTWRELVAKADVALYEAKSAGRDRIRHAGDGSLPDEHAAQ